MIIEAVQLTWATWNEICDFIDVGKLLDGKPEGCWMDKDGKAHDSPQEGFAMGLWIPTLEGLMVAQENDFIIKGVQGEIYPCKPDIFEQTYESVGEPAKNQ